MRKFQEPGIVVVENLKPSDKGEMLTKAVDEKIGHLPVGCEFMSGTKMVWLTPLWLCFLTEYFQQNYKRVTN